MAVHAWDTGNDLKRLGLRLNQFLYVDGKTSPKVAVEKEFTVEEARILLDEIRIWSFDESKDLHEAISQGY